MTPRAPVPVTVKLSVRVTESEAQSLELVAARDDRTVSSYVRRLIQADLHDTLEAERKGSR